MNTVRRWIRQGVNREGIGVIKLHSAKCGRREFVPAAALDEFLRLQNPHYRSGVEVIDSASHRAAEERLTALGV